MQVTIDGIEYAPAQSLRELEGTLGDALRGRRKMLRMTLTEAANDVGCSKGYLCQVEKNEAMPGLQMAARIARVYHLPLDTLGGFALGHNA